MIAAFLSRGHRVPSDAWQLNATARRARPVVKTDADRRELVGLLAIGGDPRRAIEALDRGGESALAEALLPEYIGHRVETLRHASLPEALVAALRQARPLFDSALDRASPRRRKGGAWLCAAVRRRVLIATGQSCLRSAFPPPHTGAPTLF